MIWVFIVASVIASLIVGTYCDRQNQKEYERGFEDGLGVQVLEIKEKHNGEHQVRWKWREKE